jgi:hypothetical protein
MEIGEHENPEVKNEKGVVYWFFAQMTLPQPLDSIKRGAGKGYSPRDALASSQSVRFVNFSTYALHRRPK